MATVTAISAEGRVRSMKHDGCKLCKYENCSMESKECIGCKQNAVDKYIRMTQFDRIKSMSIEELAEFISKVNRTCIVDAIGGNTRCDDEDVNCTECKAKFCGIQKWLQSEVEE